MDSTLTIAVKADLNDDGVHDEASSDAPEANGDDMLDALDIEALGVAVLVLLEPGQASVAMPLARIRTAPVSARTRTSAMLNRGGILGPRTFPSRIPAVSATLQDTH